MAKSRKQKEEVLQTLVEGFKNAKSIAFVAFDGLTVSQVTKLRDLCRKEEASYIVAKKTIVNLALEKAEKKVVDTKSLQGSMATVFSSKDEVVPVKILADFAKENEALKLLGGVLEGKFLDQASIVALSKLPSKQELLAKLVGSLNSPLSGLVMTLSGVPRNFVGVLQAIKDKKGA